MFIGGHIVDATTHLNVNCTILQKKVYKTSSINKRFRNFEFEFKVTKEENRTCMSLAKSLGVKDNIKAGDG
jgi:hypothetical protein